MCTATRNSYLRTLLISGCILLSCLSTFAQSKFFGEIGLLGGGSFYNGDANSTRVFKDPRLCFGGLVRVHVTNRFMIKIDVTKGGAAGDTRDFDNLLPNGMQADFEQHFWDIGLHFEHNFLKFGYGSWDREQKRHTPYILIGPGLTIYDNWVGHKTTFNLTFGVGYKFKLSERCNLGFEWSMRKLFVDNFDVTTPQNKILDDPYHAGHSWIKNNDYYTCAFVFFSVDIIQRKGACRAMKF